MIQPEVEVLVDQLECESPIGTAATEPCSHGNGLDEVKAHWRQVNLLLQQKGRLDDEVVFRGTGNGQPEAVDFMGVPGF